MKIAIINQPFDGILPPGQNSIGIWTYEVAGPLAKDNDVRVFGRHMRHLKQQNVPRIHRDRGATYEFNFAGPLAIWDRISTLWERVFGPARPIYASRLYYLEYSLLIGLRLRRFQPDIVHVHNLTGFIPIIRLLNPRTHIVLHMNCEWLSQLDQRTMARRISSVDAVLGCSDHITGLVRERFAAHAERCHTVYNGVDPDRFGSVRDTDTDRPSIVFVGRVSPEKGVHDLIEAMAEVVRRVPTARLDVIGPVGALARSFIVDVSDDPLVRDLARFYERDYGQTLAELARDCPDGTIRFLGSQTHDDVIALVAQADVLVNPSYSEAFGMSLVEALACETPVVATRIGGMPEVVGGDAGVLVERNDPVGLAAAIISLLKDADLRRHMGLAGRRRVETMFAWTRIAEQAGEVYASLIPNETSRR